MSTRGPRRRWGVSAARACALLTATAAFLGPILASAPARAQAGESAAVGKITLLNRKAVEAYQHLEFESAQRILLEALDQSERAGLTQHPIRARTFVTLGIIMIGGFKERDKAVKYFRKALQIQPEVRLSPGLANPEIQAAFDEAIAGLSSGGGELPPERALVHQPVRVGQTRQAVPITVTPDKDLEADTVVLRYRAAASASFTDLQMTKGPSGVYEAAIPTAATDGEQVAYFIEARRANGTVLMGRGSAADPIVVALAKPTAPVAAVVADSGAVGSAEGDKRVFFAIVGGTGLAWASGNGETTQNAVESSGLGWSHGGHIAPELGYFLTRRLMLGVQVRLQMVTGATQYHLPMAMMGECGGDGVCDPTSGAFAGLLKVTYLLAKPRSASQFFVSMSAGGGNIRTTSKVSSPPTCGPMGNQPCVDTVAGGPALFGPGIGFRYGVSGGVGVVAQIGGLVGVPTFAVAADVNLGIAFQL